MMHGQTNITVALFVSSYDNRPRW